ncbi:MAG: helix-turn-helix transcriptional regulator [Bacteroidales bacterium]|nr:helix-turn-helix transcriptional regulator [Bacteroidales bacterium]
MKAKKNYDIDPRLLEIANRLKELRKQKGYTSYEDFAIENDLDRKQYWRIENGSNITLKSFIKILDIHGISLNEFFRSD